MKLLLLAVIMAIVCLVLFVVAVFSPRHSRKLQRRVDDAAIKTESVADRRAGRLGDLGGDAVARSRRAADRSAEKGREVHDRLSE